MSTGSNIAFLLYLWYNVDMSIDHDSPFLDTGYTSYEDAVKLHDERVEKLADKVLGKTVAKRVRRGRPAVGEEGTLLNVDTDGTPLTPEERAEHERSALLRENEASLIAKLDGQRLAAKEQGNTYEAARFRAKIDKRETSWNEKGRGPLQLMLPGMSFTHRETTDK